MRETGLAFCPPVSFVRKAEHAILRLGLDPLAIDITLERLCFWSIRPYGKSAQNWSLDVDRGSRLSFEWIALGFTAVSFWTVG